MSCSLRFQAVKLFLGLSILVKANDVIAQEKIAFKEPKFQETAWNKVKSQWHSKQLCAQWDTVENWKSALNLQLNNGNSVEITLGETGVVKVAYWPVGVKYSHLSYAVSEPLTTYVCLPEFVDSVVDKSTGLVHYANYYFFISEQVDQKLWISMYPFRIGLVNNLDRSSIVVADDVHMPWIEEGHQITHNFKLHDGERFFGLGEKTGPLDRRGNAYTLWNTDCFGYSVDQDPMYVSVPYYVGLNGNNFYGVFVDHSAKSVFNFGAANTRFTSISVMDDHFVYYLFTGNSLAELTTKYTRLTGRTTMPPKWSLGFHQSRWGYQSSEEIEELVNGFRQRNLPLDAVHLDIPYMQANKVFTFDSVRFKNPKSLINNLQSKGVNTVVILDPGIKVEKGYEPYETGLKNNLFVKYPDGSFYEAGVWPGNCHFPDFTFPETRKFWKNELKFYADLGVKGYWNDMNEPAAWGKEVPTFIRFYAENHHWDLIKARNIYGLTMATSTFEGAQKLLGERPFVLTRAGFAGVQRSSAVWTGDNVASDEHLLLSARLINSMSMSGIGFCGADVGGFAKPASPELYVRWMSLGAFTPFYRAHKTIGMPRSEPWSFGEDNLQMVRYYLQLRYRLMPYLYANFYQMSNTGIPVNRNLVYHFNHFSPATIDANIFKESNQNEFMFGDALLVAPIASTEKLAAVYLPNDGKSNRWYHLYTDQVFASGKEALVKSPLHALPVFVKGGSIVPEFNSVGRNTEEIGDTLVIHLYHQGEEIIGKNVTTDATILNSSFMLYEDDGKSILQLENKTMLPSNGKYRSTNLVFYPQAKLLQVVKTGGSTEFQPQYRFVKVMWHGYATVMNARSGMGGIDVSKNGKLLNVKSRNNTSFAFAVPLYQTDLMALDKQAAVFEAVILAETFFKGENGKPFTITWK